ncbi:MAG: hypothetical protein B7X99_16490 [Rhizobiales bacterium 17-65-6]|nr:MAG: hypothetical protein B7X99_16490 [Rhizobiales bacterium 17-65-6]
MLAALVIVFREVLEAGLIVGVMLAASEGIAGRGRVISLGIAAGVLGSCLIALFAERIASLFDGSGQELLNATILGVASPLNLAIGFALGVLAGAVVSFILYRGLVAIPVKALFKTTTILITLLAAGLAAQSVGILQDAGFIQSLSDPLWDSSWLLADDGAVGRVLRTLVGYRAQPTGMEVAAYLATVAVIVILSRLVNGRIAKAKQAASGMRTA